MTRAYEVDVRRATLDDVDAIMAIDRAVYPRPWSKRLVADDLTRDNRHHVVARIDGIVCGHASLMTVADEGTVTTVATDPSWQRRGIARAMLLALFDHARASGIDAITLEVRAADRGAQALYRSFGFAPAGIRRGYYAPGNEDALIMWAHDIGSAAMGERLAAFRQPSNERSPHREVMS